MYDYKSIKQGIRKEILAKRNSLDENALIDAGSRLSKILSSEDIYLQSDIVLAYASYGSEIPTYKFINKALDDKKYVFLPKVVGKDMIFYRISSTEELVLGYKNILEPTGDSEAYKYDEDKVIRAMILMPGVAFDRCGNRMGYGGGFYDRFLEDKPELQKRSIAFGFGFQMIDTLPCEVFDIKPAKIVCVD